MSRLQVRFKVSILCLLLLIPACRSSVSEQFVQQQAELSDDAMSNSENEKYLLRPQNLDEQIIQKVNNKLGVQGKPHTILIFGENLDTGCAAWSIPRNNLFDHKEIMQLLTQVRTVLGGEPVIAYDGGIDWDYYYSHNSKSYANFIVVCSVTNQFDILRIEQTDGVNYDLLTEDIIRFLVDLDKEFGLVIGGATPASVWFVLKRIPTGQEATELRNKLADFSPDIEDDSLTDGYVELWWD